MNRLIILADEFMAGALGVAGHPVVSTPNLDALAGQGVLFDNAYTPSPMCVPARAALHCGRYVHGLRCWDSAEPYSGRPESWAHRLRRRGETTVSIGKLHFRSSDDDNGFTQEQLALHVVDGIGWMPALLRADPPPFDASGFAHGVGRGGSSYSAFDREVCDRALGFLRSERAVHEGTPWTLLVSFVCPHYPLNAPAEFHDLYRAEQVDLPNCISDDELPKHPAVRRIIDRAGYYRHFTSEAEVRAARVAYYGLCSYVDALVGELVRALEDTGLTGSTQVLFTSDHGEMLGNHGTWTKMLMYEDSVRVPMILRGPGVPAGRRVGTSVSLVDIAPWLLGVRERDVDGLRLDGSQLDAIANAADDPDRVAFSEYHDGWSMTGSFMLRWQGYKLVHHEGMRPQLFDLAGDPLERIDLAALGRGGDALAEGERRLRAICDPRRVNARAFSDQRAMVARRGGEAALLESSRLHFDYTPIPR